MFVHLKADSILQSKSRLARSRRQCGHWVSVSVVCAEFVAFKQYHIISLSLTTGFSLHLWLRQFRTTINTFDFQWGRTANRTNHFFSSITRPLAFHGDLLPFQGDELLWNMMNCWLGGRRSSPNSSHLCFGLFLAPSPSLTPFSSVDIQTQRVHWHLAPAPNSTAFENTPDLEMSILEPLPGLCCYCWRPRASSFSWWGWGRCLRESVHWRNGWDSIPSSFVVPVVVLLTPVDQGLDAERQSGRHTTGDRLVLFPALKSDASHKLKKVKRRMPWQ